MAKKYKRITIKFTCPKLTGKKIHKVVIEDKNLYDTWTSVCLDVGLKDGNFTHDLNAWADSLGNMDMLKVSVYPYIHTEDGIDTDYGTSYPCKILDVKGDKDLSTRMFKTVKHWGYKKPTPAESEFLVWSRING